MWEKRVAPLSGVVFAALWVVSSLLIGNFEFMPPDNEIANWLAADPVRIMTGSYVGLLAALSLTWFSGSMYSAIREIDGESRRLAFLSGAGGVLGAAMLSVSYLSMLAAAERARLHDVIDPGGAAALADLSGVMVGNGAPLGFAVMMAAGSIAALRLDGAPRRAAVASLFLAAGLISPYSWAVVALVLIWVPIAAIWMYRFQRSDHDAAVIA